LSNNETGGGSLASVRLGEEVIELPAPQIWADMREHLVAAYRDQEGVNWAGGLYVFTDVQESPGSATYYDLALFASLRGMEEGVAGTLAQFNQSGEFLEDPTPNDVTCCWEDGGAIAGGLKAYVHGLVRMVHYSRDGDFAVEHVDWHYDGEWYDAKPSGFGRMVRDDAAYQDNFIGALSDFGTADGMFAYWAQYTLVEVGESHGDYTQPAEVSFLDDLLNGGGENTDGEEPGFGELTPEEITQQQM